MPGVVRKIDNCSGHGCFPPRLPSSWSPDVLVDNQNVERKRDTLLPHCCGGCHPGTYEGDNTVLANGQPIQKKGDPIDCGSTCMDCSGSVSIG